MSSKNIREIFDDISLSVISYLEKHPGVAKVQFAERPGIGKDDIVKWEKEHFPHVLPEDYKSFLGISDGLLLKWSMMFQDEVLPLGCMQLNSLKEVVPVPLGGQFKSPAEATSVSASSPAWANQSDYPTAFDLDKMCLDGRVVFYFRTATSPAQVWFQDLSCKWCYIANSFTDYFRLMLMHLGLPHWQYAFTDIGLDPISEQWFRFLSPDRLAIDQANRKMRLAEQHRQVMGSCTMYQDSASLSHARPSDSQPLFQKSKLNLSSIDTGAAVAAKAEGSQQTGRGSFKKVRTGAVEGDGPRTSRTRHSTSAQSQTKPALRPNSAPSSRT